MNKARAALRSETPVRVERVLAAPVAGDGVTAAALVPLGLTAEVFKPVVWAAEEAVVVELAALVGTATAVLEMGATTAVVEEAAVEAVVGEEELSLPLLLPLPLEELLAPLILMLCQLPELSP
jgi:hypothetical protein